MWKRCKVPAAECCHCYTVVTATQDPASEMTWSMQHQVRTEMHPYLPWTSSRFEPITAPNHRTGETECILDVLHLLFFSGCEDSVIFLNASFSLAMHQARTVKYMHFVCSNCRSRTILIVKTRCRNELFWKIFPFSNVAVPFYFRHRRASTGWLTETRYPHKQNRTDWNRPTKRKPKWNRAGQQTKTSSRFDVLIQIYVYIQYYIYIKAVAIR